MMNNNVFNSVDAAFDQMEKELAAFNFNLDEQEQINNFDSTPYELLSEPEPQWKVDVERIDSLLTNNK